MCARRLPLSLWVAVSCVLGSFALGLAGCAQDLRGEIERAGVFSPRRLERGNDALVDLGQALFFDRELSGNRNIACANCHLPSAHAGDGRSLSRGQDGSLLPRNVIEPFNRSFATGMFWDGRLELRDGEIVGPVAFPEGIETLLEAQALLPLLDRHEMRGFDGDVGEGDRENELARFDDDATEAIWSAVLVRLLALEGYRAMFAAAYPLVAEEDLTIVHVARAIAAFESRLWELTDTAFDAFLGSVSNPAEDGALHESQRRGAELFFGAAGCARCHSGPLLSDGAFHAIGVPQIGPGRDGDFLDEGRFEVTGDPADRFAFRTPSLRNVAMTAPYMHDGAYMRLEEVVLHHLDPESFLRAYNGSDLAPDVVATFRPEHTEAIAAAIDPDMRGPRTLSDDDVWALVAFLDALTSETELTVGPGAGVPESVPSGLPVVSSLEPEPTSRD